MNKYKLLHGTHAEIQGAEHQTYVPGDIVEAESDLTRFNMPGHTKFQLMEYEPITEAPQGTEKPPEDEIASLNVKELRELAAEEEIDLSKVSKRDDILQIIRDALACRV